MATDRKKSIPPIVSGIFWTPHTGSGDGSRIVSPGAGQSPGRRSPEKLMVFL